jgi:hypothetical protein
MARPISPKGVIRKRAELRYGRLRGKPEGVPVNISGSAYHLAKKIGEWLDDPEGKGDGKSFNGVGALEVELYLIETLAYVREKAYELAQAQKAAEKAAKGKSHD